jgi:septum formation protein
MVLLRARTAALSGRRPRDLDWAPLAAGGLAIETIRGAHDNILTEPRVHALAAKLRRYLDSVRTELLWRRGQESWFKRAQRQRNRLDPEVFQSRDVDRLVRADERDRQSATRGKIGVHARLSFPVTTWRTTRPSAYVIDSTTGACCDRTSRARPQSPCTQAPRGGDSIHAMLILASASPRRAELLRAAGIVFEAVPVDIDETPLPAELPEAHVRRLAEEKALAGARRRPGATVLGADTVVVVDNRILGKPRDAGDAAAMLRTLSGREHLVMTGVSVIRESAGQGPGGSTHVEYTKVQFSPLSEEEISWYVTSGEPMDKAGAYAIQGLASRFVDRIDGSYSNVVGLPVALVYRLVKTVS